MLIDNIKRSFSSSNFASVREAYDELVSRLEEADWHVATSKQDINEYTYADEENPAVEGNPSVFSATFKMVVKYSSMSSA